MGHPPKWAAAELAGIKAPTWIVDGDRDEAIKRENTEFLAASIPNAGLLIQPQVPHFSFLQDPQQFSADMPASSIAPGDRRESERHPGNCGLTGEMRRSRPNRTDLP